MVQKWRESNSNANIIVIEILVQKKNRLVWSRQKRQRAQKWIVRRKLQPLPYIKVTVRVGKSINSTIQHVRKTVNIKFSSINFISPHFDNKFVVAIFVFYATVTFQNFSIIFSVFGIELSNRCVLILAASHDEVYGAIKTIAIPKDGNKSFGRFEARNRRFCSVERLDRISAN